MVVSQANLFLIFTLDGILIGVLFDIFRILRKSFKTADIVTYIEDTIFWLLTGGIVLYSIFVFNNGEIRLFMFIGILLGVSFYLLLFSRYVIKVSVTIINTLKNIIMWIYKTIMTPIKFIYKIMERPIKIVVINLSKIFRHTQTKNNSKTTKKKIKFHKILKRVKK
ncbi:MAG: spore cortex biosynthesis protein YabQ [Clostridia bacterium]|nr:spore cortex biosynthesis protein YabQ [Clostridia bacterium]